MKNVRACLDKWTENPIEFLDCANKISQIIFITIQDSGQPTPKPILNSYRYKPSPASKPTVYWFYWSNPQIQQDFQPIHPNRPLTLSHHAKNLIAAIYKSTTMIISHVATKNHLSSTPVFQNNIKTATLLPQEISIHKIHNTSVVNHYLLTE